MTITREILLIEEAFRLLVLHHQSEECAIDMVKEVLIEARKGENKEHDLMFLFLSNYGGGILRRVTETEIEVFQLNAEPYYVSLI